MLWVLWMRKVRFTEAVWATRVIQLEDGETEIRADDV